MNKKKSWLYRILSLDYLICGAAFIALVGITFIGVFMRYVVNSPFIWQEEMQMALIVWVVFFGAGAGFRTGGHVAIEIIVDAMPGKLRKAIEVAGYLIVIVLLGYLFVRGALLVSQMHATGRVTNILKIPNSLIYGAFPVSCILMIVNYTYEMVGRLRGTGTGEEEPEWL